MSKNMNKPLYWYYVLGQPYICIYRARTTNGRRSGIYIQMHII